MGNAFAGLGFPAEGPVTYEFPTNMFESGSDLSPINENIDELLSGLTTWAPKIKTKGKYTPPMIMVTGTDYQNALTNMHTLFLKNMWGDGLPVNPPTKDAVDLLLTGTPLSRDTVISPPGGVVPRGGIATVESIAVALAMAGGRPEYMPVLVSAVKAITDQKFGLKGLNATTNTIIPTVIVSGPVAKQIRLSSGYGLMGPDPRFPAAEVIGRAIRYVLQNLGGAIPGIGTMSIFGAFRSTNCVLAEDTDGLPRGWDSFAIEQGFGNDQNVVFSGATNSMINIALKSGTKKVNDKMLLFIASNMKMMNGYGYIPRDMWQSPSLDTGMLLMPRGFAASLARNGYSKLDVKTFLWNNSQLTRDKIVAMGQGPSTGTGEDPLEFFEITNSEGKIVLPIAAKPSQITIIVAGGVQSGHAFWMGETGPSGNNHTSDVIQLPGNWDDLLAQAEKDLGAISPTEMDQK